MKHPTSIRLSDLAIRQLTELVSVTGIHQSQVINQAIDRMYQQEIKTMKQIKVGKTNDLSLYAVKGDGRYYPLSKKDLEFETPDAKIFYDSGIYPGIGIEELPQYICDKAKDTE